MPSLDFKGKSFIYTHHLGVPYRELLVDPEKSCPAEGNQPDLDDNLIVHGDNLEALKALLPRYAGKVDCIYIDPPYNTGTEGWCYNDKVNSPLMREWLKKEGNPVEREDLQRHDKWLCMMWPRLQLLKELLAEDGAIFVSIDDNEVHRLRAMMDEVFGEESFVAEIIWKKRSTPPNDQIVGANHEYVLLYVKNADLTELNLRERGEEQVNRYQNPDNHPKGPWASGDLMANVKGGRFVESLYFAIKNPKTSQEHFPGTPESKSNWRFNKARIEQLLENNEIFFGEDGKGRPKLKRFLKDVKSGMTYPTIWDFTPLNTEGSTEMQRLFGDNKAFDNPKPSGLLIELMRLGTRSDSLILDSFAGGGTTAHAVLALNAKDGGNRKFILCETEDYADTLTAERVRRVIRGYDYTGTQETELHPAEKVTWTTFSKDKNRNKILERIESIKMFEGTNYDKIETKIVDGMLTIVGQRQVKEKMPGLGGSFTYLELGEAMDLERLLSETPGTLPSFPSLARYLFFTATGHTLPAMEPPKSAAKGKTKAKPASDAVPADAPVLIGETAVWRIYLHYQPDEAWLRSPAAAFTRTQAEAIAAESQGTGKQSLVFAAAKFINHKSLRELKVDFAQLPYALHRVQAE